jgi:thioesterase domain-containing protein
MANQLEAMGKKVSLLAMFDTNVKEKQEVIPATLSNFYHIPKIIKNFIIRIPEKVKFELFLLMKYPKVALLYKIRKIKPWFGNPESDPENIDQEVFDKLTLKLERALGGYSIEAHKREILLFNATQRYYFIDTVNKVIYKEMHVNNDAKYKWKKYAESVKFYDVKGEHSTIFDPVNAAEFSRILQQHLDEA